MVYFLLGAVGLYQTIRKAKIPLKVAFLFLFFFESTAMWGKILTLDNLQRRGKWCWLIVVSYVSKVGRVLIIFWCLVSIAGNYGIWFCVYLECSGLCPSVVHLLVCWRQHFGKFRNGKSWKAIPLCFMWAIWLERNRRAFEGLERLTTELKKLGL